jgi:hypothetical protein
VRSTMAATLRYREMVAQFDELEIGPPEFESNIFFYTSRDRLVDINALAQNLKAQGWFPGRLSDPPAVFHTVSPAYADAAPAYRVAIARAILRCRSESKRGEFDSKSY